MLHITLQAHMSNPPLLVVAGYEDGTVAVWDCSAPATYLAAVRLHPEPIMALAMLPSGGGGFSGSADNHIQAFRWVKVIARALFTF